jgi:hypothetical protein
MGFIFVKVQYICWSTVHKRFYLFEGFNSNSVQHVRNISQAKLNYLRKAYEKIFLIGVIKICVYLSTT